MGIWSQTIAITSHASGAVIARVAQSGFVDFAVNEYTKGKYTSLRHMMETGERGENARRTLENGLQHEIARDALTFRTRTLDRNPIFCKLGKDERNPGGSHLKAIFLVEITAGELRNFNLQDGDEMLGPVEWLEARRVIKRMEGHTPPLHTSACYAALEKLASNKLVFGRYQDLVTRWSPPEVSEEEKIAIETYLNRQ